MPCITYETMTLGEKLELWRDYIGEKVFDDYIVETLLESGKVVAQEVLDFLESSPAYDMPEYIDRINRESAGEREWEEKEGR